MNDGPLAIARPRADIDQRRDRAPAGDTREAPGVVDTLKTAFTVARADTSGVNLEKRNDAYKPLLDTLGELGYKPEHFVNIRKGTFAYEAIYRAALKEKANGHFADLPDNIKVFEDQWRTAERERLAEAQDTASRGNALVSFAGGMAGAMSDPLNLYSLPVGGFGKSLGSKVLTEALVGMGVEAALQPVAQANRAELGRSDLTIGEAAANVAFAGAGAAVLRGGIEVAPTVAGKAIRRIDPNWDDRQIAKAFSEMVPENLRTPEQQAALSLIDRQVQIEEANPFVRTIEGVDAHAGKLQAALDALEAGRIPTASEIRSAGTSHAAGPVPPRAPVTAAARSIDLEGVKAAIRGPESGGNDRADNALGSSAAGRYQFIEDTFVGLYQREFGVSGAAAQRAWDGNRYDVAVQERLMDRLVSDNAGALERAGIEVDTGNLYLAHFAGVGKAIELIRAPRDMPVTRFFSRQAIDQNPTYLGGGKTVGEAIETIRSKVGDPNVRGLSPMEPDNPPLRDPRLDAERPIANLAPNPKLRDEVNALLDPVASIVAAPGRSLNKLDDLAEELGSDAATVRDALQELVDRGDLRQNRRTKAFIRKPAKQSEVADQAQAVTQSEQPRALGEEVQTGLATRGFEQNGETFSKRIENFAEAGTVSDGARVVTLRLDDRQRYLERVDGFGKVEADVDLRRFQDPDDAIDAVLSGRTEPRPQADPPLQQEFQFPPRGSEAEADLVQGARARSDHADLPADPDPRFDEPNGEGISAIADSVWHDIEANPPKDDAAFDLGDGQGERSFAEIRDDIAADRSALEAIRSCLK